MYNVNPSYGMKPAAYGTGGQQIQPYAGSYTYPGCTSAPMSYTQSPGAMMAPGMQGNVPPSVPLGGMVTPGAGNIVTMPAMEESYVENILRLNRGKLATVYMTFENNSQWNAKVFKGIVEAAGRDHLILSNPETGMRYLLLMVNLDYVTFDEEIAYEYPVNGGVVTNTTPMTSGR
ncbi:spore coat protein GerQ [Paenibacillus sambharensis]|nr:spore coat protein GerQ [Paenibacillus sambharensis]